MEIPATVTDGGVTYSVTSIGFMAFRDCSGLTSVTIPNSVTSIGQEAFSGCSGLTSVTIPNSVTYIGDRAFYGCSKLSSFTATCSSGQKLKYTIINATSQIVYVETSDTTISGALVIPSTVTYKDITYSVKFINGNTFYNCKHLTSVTIPTTVTSIGGDAFWDCSGLTSVTIPNSVTSIGGDAFWDCSGLTDINVSASNAKYQSIDGILYNKAGDTLICCPVGRKGSVTIPNSVKSIGDEAFSGCSGLTSVTIPASVTSIGDVAFYGCRGLTGVTIPNSVTSIEWGAFSGCSGLTSVTIPASVTYIGWYAFDGCIGLTSVTIPASVTSIGDEAFAGCSGLTSVTISSDSIGKGVFERDTSLTSVTIGSSVTYIGDEAFAGCGSLTSVTMKADIPPVAKVDDVFSVYDTLYVPKESLVWYKITDPWRKFKTIIGVNFSDVPTIKADANLYVAGTELQNGNNEQVTVYNAMGKVVLRSDAAVISLEALPHGVYVVATSRGNMKVVR